MGGQGYGAPAQGAGLFSTQTKLVVKGMVQGASFTREAFAAADLAGASLTAHNEILVGVEEDCKELCSPVEPW